MTLQTMSFIFGALLLAVGILGGGFEVKEVKVSNASMGVRIIAGIAGLFFIGIGLWQQLSDAFEPPRPVPPPTEKTQIPPTPPIAPTPPPKPAEALAAEQLPLSPIARASTWAQSMCQQKIIKRLPSVTVESG